mgnify:CR=1 FL=1
MPSNKQQSDLEQSDSIEILLDDDLKSALQYAADLCGLSLEAFILGASTSEAIKVIQGFQDTVPLNAEESRNFAEHLLKPSSANQALIDAVNCYRESMDQHNGQNNSDTAWLDVAAFDALVKKNRDAAKKAGLTKEALDNIIKGKN